MWAARANRISAVMSISALVTAPNTCRRPPSSANSLNVAEADLKVAFAFSRLRLKVQLKMAAIAAAAAGGLSAGASPICSV